MARRKMIFKTAAGRELALPVTPASYSVETAMGVETVSVYELGDYIIPTHQTLQTIKLSALLPAHDYPFRAGDMLQDAWISWLESQVAAKSKLRFVVSGTAVNVPVYMTSVAYGESDGTNDVYATITLREYRTLSAPELQAASAASANTSRETTAQQTTETTYTVASGDTMWLIAKKYYGDGSLCYKLAAYNGIANANLITVGQVIKIPDAATLGATAATQSLTQTTVSTATKTATAAKIHTLTIQSTGKIKNYGFVTVYTPQDNGSWSFRGANGSAKIAQGATCKLTIDKNGHMAAKITLDGVDKTGLTSYSFGCVRANHTLEIAWEA